MRKIIIDGTWSIGKSTFCEKLRTKGWSYIQEPQHDNSIADLDERNMYYTICHLKNLLKFCLIDEKVVMERSIFSSIAYLYAINDDVWKVMLNESKNLINDEVNIYMFHKDSIGIGEEILGSNDMNIDTFLEQYVQGWNIIQEELGDKLEIHKLHKDGFVSNYFEKHEKVLRI